MIGGASNSQFIQVCIASCQYLQEKFIHERNLFISSPSSQIQVRQLVAHVQSGEHFKMRDETDPHVIAGAILHTLQNMPSPIFCDVLQLIMETELTSDSALRKESVVFLLQHIPQVKLDLLSTLVALLARIASIADDSSQQRNATDNKSDMAGALSLSISPFLCRPADTAFMSLRHKEYIPKVRALLNFLINTPAILLNVRSTKVNSVNSSINRFRKESKDVMKLTSTLKSEPKVLNSLTSIGYNEELHKQGMYSGIVESIQRSDEQKKEVVSRLAPPPLIMSSSGDMLIEEETTIKFSRDGEIREKNGECYDDYDSSIKERDVERKRRGERSDRLRFDTDSRECIAINSHLQYVHSQGWSVLQSLVYNRVTAFVQIDSLNTKQQSSEFKESQIPASGSNYVDDTRAATTNIKSTRHTLRRRMVAECKVVKEQIYFFEQFFSQQHNRLPRSSERGSMGQAYTRYKEMKRVIRDFAATDIQRVFRGYFWRRSYVAGEPRRKGQRTSSDSVISPFPSTSRGIFPPALNSQLVQTQTVPVLISSLPTDILMQCRQLLQEKRDIKRRLKCFDEDFSRDYGRAPKKADKEVSDLYLSISFRS